MFVFDRADNLFEWLLEQRRRYWNDDDLEDLSSDFGDGTAQSRW